VLGEQDDSGTAPSQAGQGGEQVQQARPETAQAPRQLEAGAGEELPFTGYAAIPLLLGGLGLLVSGVVLRRRTHDT
jgi:hypothetical protein